jgi:hypothetical protein
VSEPNEKRLQWLRELVADNPNSLSMRERAELDILETTEKLEAASLKQERAIARLVGMVEGVAVGLTIAADGSTADSYEPEFAVAIEQRRIAAILRDALKTAEMKL